MQPTLPSEAETAAQAHLTKALNFQQMGLTASAERELELARQADPAIVSDLRYRGFHTQKAEEKALVEGWKLPMRVGAGLLFTDLIVTGLLWLLNLGFGELGEWILWSLVQVGIDLYLAINLLRLKDTARRASIWWAVLILIFGTLGALEASSWADLIVELCLGGSLLLLFLGKPSKIRAGLAAATFVLGYLGTICAILAVPFLNATW